MISVITPCDCGELQAQFEDAVCRVFESEGSRFEILDRNMISDPFEPDITLMNGSSTWSAITSRRFPITGISSSSPKPSE